MTTFAVRSAPLRRVAGPPRWPRARRPREPQRHGPARAGGGRGAPRPDQRGDGGPPSAPCGPAGRRRRASRRAASRADPGRPAGPAAGRPAGGPGRRRPPPPAGPQAIHHPAAARVQGGAGPGPEALGRLAPLARRGRRPPARGAGATTPADSTASPSRAVRAQQHQDRASPGKRSSSSSTGRGQGPVQPHLHPESVSLRRVDGRPARSRRPFFGRRPARSSKGRSPRSSRRSRRPRTSTSQPSAGAGLEAQEPHLRAEAEGTDAPRQAIALDPPPARPARGPRRGRPGPTSAARPRPRPGWRAPGGDPAAARAPAGGATG